MTAAKFNDSKLAKELGVAPITVGRWKRGESEPNFEFLDKMATLLNTTVAALLSGPEDLAGVPADQAEEIADVVRASIVQALSKKKSKH